MRKMMMDTQCEVAGTVAVDLPFWVGLVLIVILGTLWC